MESEKVKDLLNANRRLCYAVISLAWFLFIVSYARSIFSFVEDFLFNMAIAGIIQVYSLKFCDLILLAPPCTKFQKFLSIFIPVLMIVYFSILLFFFSSIVTLSLASIYWFYLGYLMLVLVKHHSENLKKAHPMFWHSTQYTGFYLVGSGFIILFLQVADILVIVLGKALKDINAFGIFIPLVFFASITMYIGFRMIARSFHVTKSLNKLARSKKKDERKLFRKILGDSWANEVDSRMRIIQVSRLTLLCQGFLLLILFFFSCLYLLTTLNLAYITIIIFLVFSLTASFNYFSRSYGYQKIASMIKDLAAVTPSKKVADNILNFVIGLSTSLAVGAITLPILPEFLRVSAYIVFTYFLIVAMVALIGKIINPKHRSKVALISYYVFFSGTGGFTGLIASAFGIPLLIDAFISATVLAFSTILNTLIWLKLRKV